MKLKHFILVGIICYSQATLDRNPKITIQPRYPVGKPAPNDCIADPPAKTTGTPGKVAPRMSDQQFWSGDKLMIDMLRQKKDIGPIANGNTVRGNGNIVRGSNNKLVGDVNRVAGNKNSVSSNYVDVVGNNAEIEDDVGVLPDKGPYPYVNWRKPESSSLSPSVRASLKEHSKSQATDIRLSSPVQNTPQAQQKVASQANATSTEGATAASTDAVVPQETAPIQQAAPINQNTNNNQVLPDTTSSPVVEQTTGSQTSNTTSSSSTTDTSTTQKPAQPDKVITTKVQTVPQVNQQPVVAKGGVAVSSTNQPVVANGGVAVSSNGQKVYAKGGTAVSYSMADPGIKALSAADILKVNTKIDEAAKKLLGQKILKSVVQSKQQIKIVTKPLADISRQKQEFAKSVSLIVDSKVGAKPKAGVEVKGSIKPQRITIIPKISRSPSVPTTKSP